LISVRGCTSLERRVVAAYRSVKIFMRIQQKWGGCRESNLKLKEKKRITIETQVFQAKKFIVSLMETNVGQFRFIS
jgi:hypothetical protein